MGFKPDPTSKNLYEVLGVTEDASADNIRKTFRKLAREYHPDKRKEKDDDEAFKAIKEAHEVLTDETRREMYDRTGFKSEEEMMAETPGPWGPNFHQAHGGQPGGWAPQAPQPGMWGGAGDPMMGGHWGMPPGGPWDGPWGGQGAGGLFSEKLNEFLRTDLTEFGPNKPEKAKNPPATSDPSAEPTNEQKSENERKMPQNEYHRNGWNDHFEHDRFFGSDPRAGHNEHQHEPYAGFQSNGRFNPEQDPQSTIQNPMDRLHGLFREYDETMEGQWVEHDPHMMHQRHRFHHSHEPHMMHQHQRHAIHTGHGRHSWRF